MGLQKPSITFVVEILLTCEIKCLLKNVLKAYSKSLIIWKNVMPKNDGLLRRQQDFIHGE